MARAMSNTSVLLDQIMHNLHNRVGALEAQSRYVVDLDDRNNSYTVSTEETETTHFYPRILFEYGGVLGIGRTKGYLYDVWFFGSERLTNQGYLDRLTQPRFKTWLARKLKNNFGNRGINVAEVENSIRFSIPANDEVQTETLSRSIFRDNQYFKYTEEEDWICIYDLIIP